MTDIVFLAGRYCSHVFYAVMHMLFLSRALSHSLLCTPYHPLTLAYYLALSLREHGLSRTLSCALSCACSFSRMFSCTLFLAHTLVHALSRALSRSLSLLSCALSNAISNAIHHTFELPGSVLWYIAGCRLETSSATGLTSSNSRRAPHVDRTCCVLST